MSEYPLHSVLIPVYNHSDYVVECLASVSSQTYPNLELIVIDDGSTDDSARIVEEYLEGNRDRFARVYFDSRPNKGLSPTLNEGLKICQGDWIHILASDDCWYDNKVMAQWTAYISCGEPTTALLVADVDCIDDQGHVVISGRESCLPHGVSHEAYKILFQANTINAPTATIRKSVLDELGGFDESLAMEDWDCWLRIAARYPILRIPETLARYRYHAQNSHKKTAVMLEALLRTFAKFLQEHGDLLSIEERRKHWRKNLHRVYRWAKGHHMNVLPKLFIDYSLSVLREPRYDRYLYYADLIGKKNR